MKLTRLSIFDIVHALDMAAACAISYWVTTHFLHPLAGTHADLLGGMWASISTLFVFRGTRGESWSAGVQRVFATLISAAVCLVYLWFLPFTIAGLAALITAGALIATLLGRRDDVGVTAITTVVLMVLAAVEPHGAWQQPILRLLDTVIGVAVGLACKWVASFVYFRLLGEEVR